MGVTDGWRDRKGMGGTSLILVLWSVEYGESRLLEGICFLRENHLHSYHKPKDHTEMGVGQQGGSWETQTNAECTVHASEVRTWAEESLDLQFCLRGFFIPIFFPLNKFSFIFSLWIIHRQEDCVICILGLGRKKDTNVTM